MSEKKDNDYLSKLADELKRSIQDNKIDEISIEESPKNIDEQNNNQSVENINQDIMDYLLNKPDFIKNVAENPNVT